MKRKRLQFVLALLTAAAGAWAQATATTSATRTGSNNTYKVKMKEGTKDAAKWTIASDGNSTTGDAEEGLMGVAPEAEVTLKYSGRLKVKSVTATHDGPNVIDLSKLKVADLETDGNTFIVPDGTTLTGTLNGETQPYKIVIPDGGTVTLADATINGVNDKNCKWAGINCLGDAIIILADGKTNTVKGFYKDFPGIYIAEGKTLTIKGENEGTGSLTASPFDGGGTDDSYGAGIGGGYDISCGNILIEGGVIMARSGRSSAGIGGGYGNANNHCRCGNITISGGTVKATCFINAAGIGSGFYCSDCGDILISGGTVEATGGDYTTGIGSGDEYSSCGTITITKDVTNVTATKDNSSTNSIGFGDGSSCGTVTIGGTVYYDGSNYLNGGATYLAQSTLTLVNLGKLTGNYEATNGTTLFGTLKGSEQPYKVSIANNATVTLDGMDIEGVNNDNYEWAGLTCAGDATIILNDGSENTVKGFFKYYPGIFVPKDKTLTIMSGTENPGSLTASPFDGGNDNSFGAGIGGVYLTDCGAIDIQGGIITANGGRYSAGIGGGNYASWGEITISGGKVKAKGGDMGAGIGSGKGQGLGDKGYGNISITGGTVEATGGDMGAGIGCGSGTPSDSNSPTALCGDIIISGGSVTATGGNYAAGIGTGFQYSGCGKITITTGVDIVTATRSKLAVFSIGRSSADNNRHNSCGSIYIGCTLDNNGNPLGGTMYTGIGDSPFTYQPSH